ncbi:MAG: hypothetical protein KQA41_00785 [Candidatus Aenigmarchaeota archaeon]|nr:hypothetical protein [Candidatus Aenigmarchaeota archaeon]MBU5688751.1 hypothetical protein [Candidatus Aenigmarchaeota archaeon]
MKILSMIILLFFIPIATSTTIYNITLKDQKIFVNVTFDLTSEQKYDIWRISWEIPQQYEIISIKDEKGDISYTKYPTYIYFETNRLYSNKRVINIQYFLKDAISNEYDPLKKVQLYLSGFEDDKTIINVNLPGLISGDASYGFTEYFAGDFAQFVGKGAADIILFYSFSGREYENYLLFGPADLSVADNLFSLVTNITGLEKPYKRFPVVVLDDDNFKQKVQPWGTASHTRGGLILIKNSIANSPYNVSTLLHETTHGINAKILKWNQVNSTWFEEGTASFIEFLSNQHLGLEQSELFGQEKTIKQDKERIILKSKGDRNELWIYYKEGKDFMYYWNPSENDKRDFGYAFSELVIRYSVKKNGIDKIKDAYKKLSQIEKPIKDPIESTNIILSALDTNFMPCYSVDRNKFDECLNEINQQKLILPKSTDVQKTNKQIVNETIEIQQEHIIEEEKNNTNFIFQIIQKIKSILESFFKPRN